MTELGLRLSQSMSLLADTSAGFPKPRFQVRLLIETLLSNKHRWGPNGHYDLLRIITGLSAERQ